MAEDRESRDGGRVVDEANLTWMSTVVDSRHPQVYVMTTPNY